MMTQTLRNETQRRIAECARANDMNRATHVAKTIVDTGHEAVERLIVSIYDQTNGGGLLRWGEPDVANDAAATLLVLLAERDAARAEVSEVMAENDALRFVLNNMRAEIDALRARLAELEGRSDREPTEATR